MAVTFCARPATMERPMPVEPVSDADLVERSLRRDPGAFGSLVERHQRLVFGVALARCGDPVLAEDVAQDAFVTAWRDLERLHDADRVGSWVAGIARNLASNAARDRARRADAPGLEPLPVPTPEDEARGREDRELLQHALADVPAAHREVLVLYYLEGESIAHIAASLGIREDLVKQRLSRGRRALRETVARRAMAALARVRPGRGFGAGIVAAITALAARKAVAQGATGKAILVMSGTHKLALVGVTLAVAACATWFGTRARDGNTSVVAPASAAAPSSSATPAPTATPPPSHVRRLQSSAERTALVEQIRAARQQRTAGASHAGTAPAATAAPAPALPASTVDKAYIRRSVRELLPLLKDCYEQGLQRDAKLAGTVVIDFTIEGEPGVGGVIGHSAIDDGASSLSDAATRECMQETMYALEIDPPADGGVVTVKYPFAFSSDGPPP
jgi:RNA polymerase sigma factor (sigma-70 family)